MKLTIIIPTRDGGEGFQDLLSSIRDNLNYLNRIGIDVDYEVIFSVDGDPTKPLSFLRGVESRTIRYRYIEASNPGKVGAIREAAENANADILITLDDDIIFGEDLFWEVLLVFQTREDVDLVSFQTKTREYPGRNPFRKFLYDVINVRSLRSLYLGIDPFLFGRFIAIRGGDYPVPPGCIIDDMYLSIHFQGRYVIREKPVYSYGLDSLFGHTKRVLRLEAGRKQMAELYPETWREAQSLSRRVIDREKLAREGLYWRVCYYSYRLLRLFTNGVIAKILAHRGVDWQ